MEILQNLFGPFASDLQRAMTQTTQRHALIVNNLANVNTPGYKRKDMDFGIVLEEEMQKGPEAIDRALNETFGGLQDETSIRLDGNNVDLEREVTALAETELRYQALTDLANSYFSGLKNVIREGR